MVSLTPFMVRSGVARAPAELGSWLRREGFDVRGEPDHKSEMARWLDKSSIRLSELEPGVIEAALTRATTRMDGQAMWANDIMAMVDFTKAGPKASRRYAALFACVGIAGMRPSGAMALRVEDLTLPHRGWGMAMLRGATTSPGARYTNTAGVHEDKQLKQRAVGAVRPAPLAPVLVGCLRQHLVEFPAGDRVFTTSRGTPMSTTSYSEAWRRARADRWSGSSVLGQVTLYDLRHSAATLMLRAGVMPAEVARRLGHSVDVLMRTYAGVLDDEVERSNLIIEQEHQRAIVQRRASTR